MSQVLPDLRYAKSHEWVRTLPDGTLEVGITDHAQGALGDLVFVELPEVGRVLEAGAACAVVESVKAASDVYSPIGGTVLAVNEALAATPELINHCMERFNGMHGDFKKAFEDLNNVDTL